MSAGTALSDLADLGDKAKGAVPLIVPLFQDRSVAASDGVPLCYLAANTVAVLDDSPEAIQLLIEALHYNAMSRAFAFTALQEVGPKAKAAVTALQQLADGSLAYTGQTTVDSPQSAETTKTWAKETIKIIQGKSRSKPAKRR